MTPEVFTKKNGGRRFGSPPFFRSSGSGSRTAPLHRLNATPYPAISVWAKK